MMLSEKQITLNGLSINYIEGGSGHPMIFMHNGGGFYHSWEHQLEYFSENFHVFGIDWPGFGESQAPEGLITLDLLTEVLSGFIDKLKLESCILVGNCIGGSAALKYTLLQPEKVEKLLIFNICPGDLVVKLPAMRRYLISLYTRPRRKRITGKILAFSVMKTPIKHRFPKILFGKNPDKKSNLYQRYQVKFAQKSTMNSRLKLLFAASTYNLADFLPNDNVPEHLLVWGEHNRVTPLESHGTHHRNLLQSENFEVVKNAGHLCMYEQPEAVISIIEKYLSKS